MSRQLAEHIDGLLKPLDDDLASTRRRDRRKAAPGSGESSRPARGRHPDAVEAPVAATSDDTAQVRDTLEQQNELLRAILASSVDTQDDARATAQNSRTFAWAGTVIALLTLIATVISIVAAVRAP